MGAVEALQPGALSTPVWRAASRGRCSRTRTQHCQEGARSSGFHHHQRDAEAIVDLDGDGVVWDQEKSQVPLLALQYYRSYLMGRFHGGAAREALTLPWAMDLILQGKIAQTADCMTQRLKCLEMTSAGSSWMVSQRVEVVPPERGQLSSRAEAQAAAKENKEELKAWGLGKGKRKGQGRARPGKLAYRWQRRTEGQRKRQGEKRRRQGGQQKELLGKGADYEGAGDTKPLLGE